MLDAKINYDEVDQGVACYCVSDTKVKASKQRSEATNKVLCSTAILLAVKQFSTSLA